MITLPILIVLSLSPAAYLNALPEVKTARFDTLAAYMEPYVVQHDFAGVVYVGRASTVSYSAGFGGATVGDRFMVGSISKTFAAAAIELLTQRGKIGYGNSLSKYVPEYKYAHEITIKQLLEHSAGVPDFYSIRAFAADHSKNMTLPQIVRWLNRYPLDFAPGTKNSYSNSGYSLLALVVERVSGQRYGTFLRHALFGPLGLRETKAEPNDSNQPIAHGWFVGNGDVSSSAHDMSVWLDLASGGKIVNAASLPYPFGWAVASFNNGRLLEQDGRIPGYAASISIDRATGLKVVVLSSIQCSVASDIANSVRLAAAGQALSASPLRTHYSPTSAELAPLVGEYSLSATLVVRVMQSGTRLMLENENDGIPYDLEAIAPGRFYFRPLDAVLTFQRNASGDVSAISWNDQFVLNRLVESGSPQP